MSFRVFEMCASEINFLAKKANVYKPKTTSSYHPSSHKVVTPTMTKYLCDPKISNQQFPISTMILTSQPVQYPFFHVKLLNRQRQSQVPTLANCFQLQCDDEGTKDIEERLKYWPRCSLCCLHLQIPCRLHLRFYSGHHLHSRTPDHLLGLLTARKETDIRQPGGLALQNGKNRYDFLFTITRVSCMNQSRISTEEKNETPFYVKRFDDWQGTHKTNTQD